MMSKKLQLVLFSNEIIQKKATSSSRSSGACIITRTTCIISRRDYCQNTIIGLPSSAVLFNDTKSRSNSNGNGNGNGNGNNAISKLSPTSYNTRFHTTRCRPLLSPSYPPNPNTNPNPNPNPKKIVKKNPKDDDNNSSNNNNNNNNDDDGNDDEKKSESSSVLSLLIPSPLPNPPEIEQMEEEERRKNQQLKPKLSLRQGIVTGWNTYLSTWDGFFDNHGRTARSNKDDSDKDNDKDNDNDSGVSNNFDIDIDIAADTITKKQKEIRKNMKRNVKSLKKEGAEVLEAAKNFTGIRTKNDLVAWSMEQLKLANECVGQFMAGYRKGRDEEIDKMMNEYFKDFEFEGGGGGSSGGSGSSGGDNGKGDEQLEIQPGRKRRGRKSKW